MTDRSTPSGKLKNILLIPLDKSITVFVEGNILYHLGECDGEGVRPIHLTRLGQRPECMGLARLVGSGQSATWMLDGPTLCLVIGQSMILDYVGYGQSITSNIVGVMLSQPIETREQIELRLWREELIS